MLYITICIVLAMIMVWQYSHLNYSGQLLLRKLGYKGSYILYVVGCLLAFAVTYIWTSWIMTAASIVLGASLFTRLAMEIFFGRIFTNIGERIQLIATMIVLWGTILGVAILAVAAIFSMI